MDLIEGLMMLKKSDHYTNELYSLVTGSECGPEQSEERLKNFKGSLKKYMEIQRLRTTMAKENCLKRALICIWLFVRLLILIFCVLLRICKFFYCLFCSMCNLSIILRKLLIIPWKIIIAECKTPRWQWWISNYSSLEYSGESQGLLCVMQCLTPVNIWDSAKCYFLTSLNLLMSQIILSYCLFWHIIPKPFESCKHKISPVWKCLKQIYVPENSFSSLKYYDCYWM